MTYGASTARTLTVKDGVTVEKGELLLLQSDGEVDLTAVTELAHFVAIDESSRDVDGVFDAADATVTGMPIGGVCFVAATAAEAWVPAQLLYVGANGLATKTAGSNKKLGVFLGTANVTTVAGDVYAVNTAGADQA
jgi:hypothetical protein